ncbi:MAG: protein-S-isoprenylcysteine methyltransferase [Bdellovibrionaceae bacterium]|nr:protein-S-isoprenylcysteine methyltransferase [Pseudobdellovibrionaceae bacterium]|tara:strand:+ start:76147 stop:76599 length:453 start_codon:yes stop_codon:yes gene_type:complete
MFLECKIPPLIVAFSVGLIMWTVSQISSSPALPNHISVSIALFLLASAVALLAVINFKKAKTTVDPRYPEKTTELVIAGIYKYSRNPMYLAFFLWLIAFAAYLSNVYALLISPVFILYMNRFQIAPEERSLETLFGNSYHAYKKQTRRWL